MHELRPYQSYQDIYVFVMRVVNLYDTQIISVLRTFSDVRRLAYFVHEMIEGLLEIPLYQTNLAKEYGVSLTTRSFCVALFSIALPVLRFASSFRMTAAGISVQSPSVRWRRCSIIASANSLRLFDVLQR